MKNRLADLLTGLVLLVVAAFLIWLPFKINTQGVMIFILIIAGFVLLLTAFGNLFNAVRPHPSKSVAGDVLDSLITSLPWF